MFAGLLKRYIVLHAAKAIHTTTAAVGRNVYQMVLGIGLLAIGLLSVLFTVIVLLGSAFLYLSNLRYDDSLLIIGLAWGVISAIMLIIGSSKLKRA